MLLKGNNKFVVILLLLLVGCGENQTLLYQSANYFHANRLYVSLSDEIAEDQLTFQELKGEYLIYVAKEYENIARKALDKNNHLIDDRSLDEILSANFTSLSKMEEIKTNLIKQLQVEDILRKQPWVRNANVYIHGEKGNVTYSVLVYVARNPDPTIERKLKAFLTSLETDGVSIESVFIYE